MSSASTIGLPYNNLITLSFVAPAIVSGTNFLYTFIDNVEIPAGKYLASCYIEIVEGGGDTELGTVLTSYGTSGGLVTNIVPFTSNYLGNTQVLAMEGTELQIQNMQLITVLDTAEIALGGNIVYNNTAPTAGGYIFLQAI